MKQLKTIFAIATIMAITTQASFAQNSLVTANQDPFTITYIGEQQGYQCFQMIMANDNAKTKLLNINDKEEGVLYQQNITSLKKPRVFKIEKQDDQVLIFSVTIDGKQYTKSYSFSTTIFEKIAVKESDLVVL